MQPSSSPEFNPPEINREGLAIPHQEQSEPTVEIYEPKFKHIQEDLKYMFGIAVEHEEELTTPEVRQKMYDKAVVDFLQGNPFSLEYFLEEDLLTPDYIKADDIPKLKKAATSMAYSMRHLARRTRSKELFLEAGILTKDEVNEISELSNQVNN